MDNRFKEYSKDKDCYLGLITDRIDLELRLFIERCDQVNIPKSHRVSAFSIMLGWYSLQFFVDCLLSKNLDLMKLAIFIKKKFRTPERTQALFREWETASLKGVMTVNTGKKPSVCMELWIIRLIDIQKSLQKSIATTRSFGERCWTP